MNLKDLLKEFEENASVERAKASSWYFKTGSGQYGEGDKFIGLTVPQQRMLAAKYKDLSLVDLQTLLDSKIHEHRLTALIILTNRFQKTDSNTQKVIFDFYLKNLQKGKINNWDLIDLSAPNIIGKYLLTQDRSLLYKLAQEKSIWSKRVAVLATFTFIKENDFKASLQIAEVLLTDKHDLIHKAVGWMLREIGKKDLLVEEEFLNKHYKNMPRTMLRYAIEKLSPVKKARYMKKT